MSTELVERESNANLGVAKKLPQPWFASFLHRILSRWKWMTQYCS